MFYERKIVIALHCYLGEQFIHQSNFNYFISTMFALNWQISAKVCYYRPTLGPTFDMAVELQPLPEYNIDCLVKHSQRNEMHGVNLVPPLLVF